MHSTPLVDLRRYTRLALAILGGSAIGCFPRAHVSRPVIDGRDMLVYQVVADSLYLSKAGGRPIAIANRTLDTACDRATCAPIGKRWGLDSLWWARDDAALARQIRDVLITRAGTPLTWDARGMTHPRIVLVELAAVPAQDAGVSAWSAFQSSTGVAALQFSPIGFSADGSRALVIVRMRCGPRCGHLLAAGLVLKEKRWTIGELLLVSSES